MDCSEFQNDPANKCPLYPGKVNRWLLARSDDGNPPESIVRADVERALSSLKNSYQGLKVLKATQDGALTLAGPIVKRREQLTGVPLLSGKRPWYVSIEFNYYGQTESIPWPITGGTLSCDLNQLDWTLCAVGGPLKAAPPEQTLADDIKNVASEAADVVASASSGLTKILLAGATVIGLGWLVLRKVEK